MNDNPRQGVGRWLERASADFPLFVLRAVFVMVAIGLATIIERYIRLFNFSLPWIHYLAFGGTILVAIVIVILDAWGPAKRIDTVSAVYFGLLIGMLLTYILSLAFDPLFQFITADANDAKDKALANGIRSCVLLLLGMVLCYACISTLLQTKDDFRFIIPYVEFAKEVKGQRPYLLDTSVVIDGRIGDLVESNVFDSHLIMPRFALTELQAIADSPDKLRRARGRRGLDVLNKLRNSPNVDLKISDREPPELAGQSVDMKLVLLARHLEAKIVTGDYNLNKVAKLHNVPVINLNDVANALKSVFLPGELLELRIVRPGEEPGQGVGHLDDGTMVVVEGGREYIGQTVRIVVTNVLQTSSGRLVFGKLA